MNVKDVIVSLILIATPTVFASQISAVVPLYDKGLSTFYVQGKFGTLADTELMVDTGSGYMTINENSLSQLKSHGEVTYVKRIIGRLADGTENIVEIWNVHQLTINNKCVLTNVEAAVFPGNTRQILGLSALKKASPFIFSIDPPQLTLSACIPKKFVSH